MAAAAKCEASGCRQQTYVPSARGAALAELACPADAPARGVSHRGAALGGQGRASWTPGAAGLARVWRPALVPPLVPRTSQWRAVPSHALGCLAPEVAGAGTEGLGGTQSCNEGPTGSRLRRAHPRLARGSPDGDILPLRHPGLSRKFCRQRPFPRTANIMFNNPDGFIKHPFSDLGWCLGWKEGTGFGP